MASQFRNEQLVNPGREAQVCLPLGPVVERPDPFGEQFVELFNLFASGLVEGLPLLRGVATAGHRRGA